MKGKNGNLCLSDCILMACAIFFKSFRGAERANPTQSRGNARLCSIAGLVAWLVEIPSGLGSLGENKALKSSKAFLHMCSPPLPPPCCCFSSQSSCERLPLKVKLGLERSSAGAVSPPASSLFPPEVTQGGTASLPPCLDDSSDLTAGTGLPAVPLRGAGIARRPGAFGRARVHFSSQASALGLALCGTLALRAAGLVITVVWLSPLKPRAFLQGNQVCARIVLQTGSG